MIRRIAAGLAGVLTLVFCAVFTVGTVLAAPVGVLLARTVARRRQRRLTRGAAWLGAVVASFLALLLAFAGMLAMAPPDTMKSVRASMDSAQAHQTPAELPKWLQRITPPPTQGQRALTEQMVSSNAFVVWAGIVGTVIACAILGTIAGSIGWVASMLLAYASTGRWLPGAEVIPAPTTEAE